MPKDIEKYADEIQRRLMGPQKTDKDELPDFYGENGKFMHNIMGDYLIEKYGCCKIRDTVHIYDDGVYRPGEEALHGIMVELVPSLPDTKRREVFKYIKVCRKTPVKELAPPNLIPFRHNIYDIKTDFFWDYSPEYVFLNRFPWDYDPDAPECATVTNTINAIANNDTAIVNLLAEAFGNCFYRVNQYRGAILLYGPTGNNGKSTLLNMLRQMIGTENASVLSLQDTAEKFRLIEIYGKAVNIGDDIPSSYIPDSSTFKKLVTGDPVMAEKKGQDPIDYISYAKMFFAMNELPAVSDKSQAFFSRVLLVPLNNYFSAKGRRDVSLKDKKWSQEEMEYLVRFSMDGLRRLMAQGDFTKPDCVMEAMQEYELENNPVLGFLEEYHNNLVGRSTDEVYDDFKVWCYNNGHKGIPTKNRFSKEICRKCRLKTKSRRLPVPQGGRNFERYFAKP